MAGIRPHRDSGYKERMLDGVFTDHDPERKSGRAIVTRSVSTHLRKIVVVAACVAFAAFALLVIGIVLGIAGYGPRWQGTDVTRQKPYSDFIGREYRVIGDISAYAWNDFPDKAKILTITLSPPPGTRNRFVSSVTPLQKGQRVRVLSAWRSYDLLEIIRRYAVAVPDAGLPNGGPITMRVGSDGVPDPRFFEPIDQ